MRERWRHYKFILYVVPFSYRCVNFLTELLVQIFGLVFPYYREVTVAQLARHPHKMQKVPGSIPLGA